MAHALSTTCTHAPPFRVASREKVFKTAMELTGMDNWQFGEVREVCYPLLEIDTFLERRNGGRPSVLRLLVEHRRYDHIGQVWQVRKLLRDKWSRFGRAIHRIHLFTFFVTLVLLTAQLFTLDVDDVLNTVVRRNSLAPLALCTACMALFRLPSLEAARGNLSDMLHFTKMLCFKFSVRKVLRSISWLWGVAVSCWTFMGFIVIGLALTQDEGINRLASQASLGFASLTGWIVFLQDLAVRPRHSPRLPIHPPMGGGGDGE